MNTLRLPLWKNCLDAMRSEGLEYSKTFNAHFFEEHLKAKRDEMAYSLGISMIRRELESEGFYLSGRGMKGNALVILPPESNREVLGMYSRQALDALRRGVTLGMSTKTDNMLPADKKKHEATLEKIATRCALLQRSGVIAKALRKHSPDLIAEVSE